MTVRVWIRPSELGERGHPIEFAEAYNYEAIEDGTLLLFGAGEEQVGIVYAGRWDAAEVLDDDNETADGDE